MLYYCCLTEDSNGWITTTVAKRFREEMRFSSLENHAKTYTTFLPAVSDTASSNMYPEVSSFEEVSASFFLLVRIETSIARNVVSRFYFLCCASICVYGTFIHVHRTRTHTMCVYIPAKK